MTPERIAEWLRDAQEFLDSGSDHASRQAVQRQALVLMALKQAQERIAELEAALAAERTARETAERERDERWPERRSRLLERAEAAEAQRDEALEAVADLRAMLATVEHVAPGYDWNVDPHNMTLEIGKSYEMAQRILSSPDARAALERQRALNLIVRRAWNAVNFKGVQMHDDEEVEELRSALEEYAAIGAEALGPREERKP